MPFTTSSLRFFSVRNFLCSSSSSSKVVFADNRRFSFSLPMASSDMDSGSSYTLVLCGKSTAEDEIAKSIKSNNALKLPDNSNISIVLKSELEKPLKEDSFGIDSFLHFLSTNQFGRFLIWSPRLPSTHDVVSHNFCELPSGAVCVADYQEKGRGRAKNVWESPPGCLMFSFTIEMEDGRTVPLLQYVVSLAITEAIKDVCDQNGLPCVDVKIKWPNDIYLNGLKIGGILCTSTYRSKKFNVSAGIGLNIDNDKPTTSLNAVLRELSVEAYQFSRQEILAAFFNKFEKLYDLFSNQGFQTLEELYCRTWLHSGQRVCVQEQNGDEVVETAVTIQVQTVKSANRLHQGDRAVELMGLTSSGYLLAIGDDNQMYELHPDGNSLDFFRGLIRRKLD